ncbi:MAG TPA: hypothetical protein VEA58_10670 [Anaerovoracaceae bacterium]|nr:hypothetical protein [Anaerovoracaceae bacterium]
MLLNYKNLSKETKEKYYLLHKLGLINYDLISCVKLISNNKYFNDPSLNIYCSKILYVHINEALKYLRGNQTFYEKYIDKTNNEIYSSIKKEMDFDNKKSYNNLFIKDFRSTSIHYTDEKKFLYIDEFYKTAKKLSRGLPNIETSFPPEQNVESKSIMVYLNMFITNKNITTDNYASIMFNDMSEKLIIIINNIIHNLLNELEG